MQMWQIRPALVLLLGSVCIAKANAEPNIRDIFQNSFACALISPLLADMTVEPVYEQSGTQCVSVIPVDDQDALYFVDDSCQEPLEFETTSLISHCEVLLDSSKLGEGQYLSSAGWTLPPGTRIDVGARPLSGVTQPYLQRRIYKTVETTGGQCQLEMRVYTPHPAVQGRGSILALHGGSWSARGFGFFGLELTIPHFVEQGFVVYAPFYRLLEDSDGSAACQNATITQITDDASTALAWVRDNAPSYGSASVPVVFGQSAGAHLAASLAVNEPESVAAAVLFYPPTDFTDFALRARQGYYTNEQGLGILDSVIGVSAEQANISASPIAENSFPIRIIEGGLSVPPMFILHGMEDDLVEARQSVRLCDALAGRELMSTEREVAVVTPLRETIQCGDQSSLQLIREGDHALDVCFADAIVPSDLCPSGSEASRQEVSKAIADAAAFAVLHATQSDSATEAPDENNGSENSGTDSEDNSAVGGGVLSAWWLLLLTVSLLQKGQLLLCPKCIYSRHNV